jgi:hydroxyacylglutathione hydrolase
MAAFETVLIPCLTDNYCVLLHSPETGETAAIDTPDAATIQSALTARGWKLDHIFITHHHNDHTAGIVALKSYYGCPVIGPEAESDRISGLSAVVNASSEIAFAGQRIEVIETPGHTVGHVTYHIPASQIAFTGDTLFSLGCGRIFEGNPELMWQSLCKIAALPDETKIFCGHEYTLANGRFAVGIEPENERLKDRVREVEELRAAGKPTLPTTIALEKATNPFLRPASKAIRARLGLEGEPDVHVFRILRELRNKS